MSLTSVQIGSAKPKSSLYRLSDGRGLALEVTPQGNKRWRYRYSFGGKEKMFSLGLYPEVSLKDARNNCFVMRQLVAKGIDPSEQRQLKRAKTIGLPSFETVATEWFEKNQNVWTKKHAEQIWRRLERDIFPWIGKSSIETITPPELLKHLRKIESRGAIETAHRVKGCCGQIFRYAVATGRAERDVTQDLRDALTPVKVTHLASITDPQKIGDLLRLIDSYEGYFVTKSALKLAPLTFVRPGELRQAEWAEINLEKAEWRIPAEKMKARVLHIVPLSKQAQAVLKEIHSLTGHYQYVFPCIRTNRKPMSNNAVLSAL
ncbi:MAG: integrase arm-type DNA-binding domain-containing protein [Bdellovibrionales bacterium]|nr:integrase arm-type DNA-binding domain-containing protein [Bdellovibrionales bacterium]